MVKLDCSVASCSYNTNNTCKRENITVGGKEAHKCSETVCQSFVLKGTNTMQNACCSSPKKETKVCCDAVNCKYNDAKICNAAHIGIAGAHAVTNGETECGSFECK